MFTVAMLYQRQRAPYQAAKTDFELSVPCVSALSYPDLFGHRHHKVHEAFYNTFLIEQNISFPLF